MGVLATERHGGVPYANSGTTNFGNHPGGMAAGQQLGATASRPRGPKSSVQSLTYMPTNWSALAAVQAAAERQGIAERLVAMLQAVDDARPQQPLHLGDLLARPRSWRRTLAPSGSGKPVSSNHHWPMSTTSSSCCPA